MRLRDHKIDAKPRRANKRKGFILLLGGTGGLSASEMRGNQISFTAEFAKNADEFQNMWLGLSSAWKKDQSLKSDAVNKFRKAKTAPQLCYARSVNMRASFGATRVECVERADDLEDL
jgi:hypothetical protein